MYDWYSKYKKQWHDTKPIRGRAEDVRPIKNRRRDWEQLVRRVGADGTESYGVKLRGTVVAEFYPDNSITLRTGGRDTQSTSKMINAYTPFECRQQYGFLWVRSTRMAGCYPLRSRETRFVRTAEFNYKPDPDEPIPVRRIDINKAKDAREPFKPFLDWAKVMLAISDGWVANETLSEAAKGLSMPTTPEARYALLLRLVREEQYIGALHLLLRIHSQRYLVTYDTDRLRIDYNKLKTGVYNALTRYEGAYKTVLVPAGDQPIEGVIRA